jgi:type IV secretory pathway VirB10-like protein
MGGLIVLLSSQMDFSEKPPENLSLSQNIRSGPNAGLMDLVMGLENAARETPQPRIPEPNKPPEKDIRGNIVINKPPQREERQATPAPPPASDYYSYAPYAQAAGDMRNLKTRALTERPDVQDFKRTQEDRTRTNIPAQPDMTIRAAVSPTATGGDIPAAPQQPLTASQQKNDFLYNPQGAQNLTKYGYSENLPLPQQFRWELKAGTMIPTILMNGVDSSIPGMVRAQVAENVWDTAFGSHVLIPKGTMVLGIYNTDVRFGDQRIMFVWNRLIFPNGMTLNIAGTPGTDQSGYSGVSGRVNEHWDKMFMSALISSLFIAGAEILVGDDNNSNGIAQNNENKSPRDVMAEALGASILDMSSKLIDRTMDIAPTIRIKPGKRMGLFVNEDIIFPFPYPMQYRN